MPRSRAILRSVYCEQRLRLVVVSLARGFWDGLGNRLC